MTPQEYLNFTTVAIVQSDSTRHTPPLSAIDILAAGDLKIEDSAGNTPTIVFPAAAAGGSYPFRFVCQIAKVFDTGTTLTDAQMTGLRN